MAGLVAEIGAVALYDELRAGRDARGLLTDVAGRLAEIEPERDLERAVRRAIRWIVPGDEEWPASLDDLDRAEPLHRMGRAPLGLWVRGAVRLHELTTPVAVVGSRSATTYGTGVAADLGAGVARAGAAVVSGAAFGIDEAAHRGALAASGTTVAVLACGVDRAYPAAHKRLLDHLAEHGAVVSELAPGCAPTRLRFLARNRVIAGLSQGTVVVEAAVRSGALNTASWTSLLHRPLMGVPGPVTSAPSEGVHELVRSGAATLVTRAGDVLELVGGMGEHLEEAPRAPVTARDLLDRVQQRVLEAVPVRRPASPESIGRTAGLGAERVRSVLDDLARRGHVDRLPTGWRLAEATDAVR
ncbi:DNA-protecting protein DprA [Nocardioides anomalus]|uniref:DNA-protecting protein DprA n=2 Tax=Nocardioides anomalus TaxID=2712223 RepID=A0A6G6WKP5_9ACTN|nr:DNA-protecting protein DprA [Nocardioides anomalus]